MLSRLAKRSGYLCRVCNQNAMSQNLFQKALFSGDSTETEEMNMLTSLNSALKV